MPVWLRFQRGLRTYKLPRGRLVHHTYSVPLFQCVRGLPKLQQRRWPLWGHRRKLLALFL